MTKKIFQAVYVIVLLLTVILGFVFNSGPQVLMQPEEDGYYETSFLHGKIISLEEETAVVHADSSDEKGEDLEVTISDMINFNTYQAGDEILIYKSVNRETGETTYEIADYYHQSGIFWIFIIFTVFAFVIAGKKGITAILSVLISLALFFFILLKMIGLGYPIVLSCLLFTFLVTVLTIPTIHGFNKKSLSAVIAIFIGYVASLAISYIFKNIAALGTAPGEEFRLLKVMFDDIDISDVLIASLFLGAIGALIDTAISIASAIFEALKEHANLAFKKVYKIGMEVGKDILGSMINTLLFAYLASSLPFLLLLSLGEANALSELLNMDFIALELTRTFIGALSLVLVIPIVASIASYFLTKVKDGERKPA